MEFLKVVQYAGTYPGMTGSPPWFLGGTGAVD